MTETIIWPEDGLRARIAELEADLADLHSSFMADASIHKAEVAELEAENERLREQASRLIARANQAEATVERLTWMFDELAKACSSDLDASDGIWVVYQRRWAARAEEGGG